MGTWVCNYHLCCCLYPLRKGLQIWGYMNLIRYCLLDGISTSLTANRIRFHFLRDHEDYEDILSLSIMFLITFVISICNLAFNILFVVGIHKNDDRKIRSFFFFWLVKVMLYGCYMIVGNILGLVSFEIGLWLLRHIDPVTFYLTSEAPVAGIFDIVVQIYYLMLVRNLYKTLDKGDQRRIVNSFDFEVEPRQRDRPVSFDPVRRTTSEEIVEIQPRFSSRF